MPLEAREVALEVAILAEKDFQATDHGISNHPLTPKSYLGQFSATSPGVLVALAILRLTFLSQQNTK